MEVDSDEEDDEETQAPTQSYMSLMRSLQESAPNAKRRKLDHEGQGSAKDEESDEDEDDDEDRDVDSVDEAEEDPADAGPEDLFDEDDDLDSTDPFELHFSEPKEEEVQPRLNAIKGGKWRTERVAGKSTRIYLNTPDTGNAEAKTLPAAVSGISDLKLKKKLHESMEPTHSKFDQIEQTVAPLLFNYQDLLYCNRTVANSESVKRMTCLHALNHIFK